MAALPSSISPPSDRLFTAPTTTFSPCPRDMSQSSYFDMSQSSNYFDSHQIQSSRTLELTSVSGSGSWQARSSEHSRERRRHRRERSVDSGPEQERGEGQRFIRGNFEGYNSRSRSRGRGGYELQHEPDQHQRFLYSSAPTTSVDRNYSRSFPGAQTDEKRNTSNFPMSSMTRPRPLATFERSNFNYSEGLATRLSHPTERMFQIPQPPPTRQTSSSQTFRPEGPDSPATVVRYISDHEDSDAPLASQFSAPESFSGSSTTTTAISRAFSIEPLVVDSPSPATLQADDTGDETKHDPPSKRHAQLEAHVDRVDETLELSLRAYPKEVADWGTKKKLLEEKEDEWGKLNRAIELKRDLLKHYESCIDARKQRLESLTEEIDLAERVLGKSGQPEPIQTATTPKEASKRRFRNQQQEDDWRALLQANEQVRTALHRTQLERELEYHASIERELRIKKKAQDEAYAKYSKAIDEVEAVKAKNQQAALTREERDRKRLERAEKERLALEAQKSISSSRASDEPIVVIRDEAMTPLMKPPYQQYFSQMETHGDMVAGPLPAVSSFSGAASPSAPVYEPISLTKAEARARKTESRKAEEAHLALQMRLKQAVAAANSAAERALSCANASTADAVSAMASVEMIGSLMIGMDNNRQHSLKQNSQARQCYNKSLLWKEYVADGGLQLLFQSWLAVVQQHRFQLMMSKYDDTFLWIVGDMHVLLLVITDSNTPPQLGASKTLCASLSNALDQIKNIPRNEQCLNHDYFSTETHELVVVKLEQLGSAIEAAIVDIADPYPKRDFRGRGVKTPVLSGPELHDKIDALMETKSVNTCCLVLRHSLRSFAGICGVSFVCLTLGWGIMWAVWWLAKLSWWQLAIVGCTSLLLGCTLIGIGINKSTNTISDLKQAKLAALANVGQNKSRIVIKAVP